MDYLGYHARKIALLCKEKNRVHIRAFSEYEGDVKQLYKNRLELVTGLKTSEVLLRSLTLKLKSKREIMATLPFQVETLIPYPDEELILLPTIEKKKHQTEVFLLATSKTNVKNHLDGLHFTPDRVSCIPVALYRFARHCFPTTSNLFIHHEEVFVVIQEGKLQAAHLAKSDMVERISAYVHKKYPQIDHFFTTSPIDGFSHLHQLELAHKEWGPFATPIGLALDASCKDSLSVQFRQGELVSPKKRAQQKKHLAFFVAACAACCLCIATFSHLKIKQQERRVLTALNAPRGMNLQAFVSHLENQVYDKKKGQLTISTVPKVSEVLAWLSAHPKLSKDCSITHFQYQIIRFPKLGTSARGFEAKIELELFTKDPRAARGFHEALLKDQEIVNSKMDVKWTADHGVYRTAFYLKEKRLG